MTNLLVGVSVLRTILKHGGYNFATTNNDRIRRRFGRKLLVITKKSLSRLEKVDLRDIWISEASSFTPWLATEENLDLLSDTLDLDLVFEATEQKVGSFRADILCRDTENGHWVLIENQLELTDHKHLGQLLTYASGLQAVTILWISARFTEEHRSTLDWLNEITKEEFRFFGLEIEAWRIGESPAAPKFNVVAKPNDWSRSVARSAAVIKSEAVTPTKILQQAYWTKLSKSLISNNSVIRPQKPHPQHWTEFGVGRSGFNLSATVNNPKQWIAIALYLGSDDAKRHFADLSKNKEDIESQINAKLIWMELPNRKSSRVEIRLENTNPSDENDWQRQHAWMMDNLEAFYHTFRPLIREL